MNECWDCVYYYRDKISPPECINPDRLDDEEWPRDKCEWKMSISDAKYRNKEGL